MVWPKTNHVTITRKTQMPQTCRCPCDVPRAEPCGSITRDSIIEPNRLGKDLLIDRNLWEATDVMMSQASEITVLGYIGYPEIAPSARAWLIPLTLTDCNHREDDPKSRRGHFCSDVEVFAFTASSISLSIP